MSTKVRRCAVCHNHITTRKNGTIRQHLGDWWVAGKATTCTGSGQPPAEDDGTTTSNEEQP